jgi:AraC-like DNA-binding protein
MCFSHSSLGLTYHQFIPDKQFLPYLTAVCEIKGIPQFEFERITPSNGIDIIINLGSDLKGVFGQELKVLKRGDLIIRGNQVAYYDSIMLLGTHFISAQLSNLGFQLLFDMPASEIQNTVNSELKPDALRRLSYRLVQGMSVAEFVSGMGNWISSSLDSESGFSLAEYLVQVIEANPFCSSRDLEKCTGYSAKYLNRIMKEYSGYTISYFKRLCRFNRAANMLRSSQHGDWLNVIYDNKFYDQSHFIKEIKHFTGLTPSELSRQYHDSHRYIVFQ